MIALGRILYLVPGDATEAVTSWQVLQLARAAHAEVVLLALRQRWWWPFGAAAERAMLEDRLADVAARFKGYATASRVEDGEPLAVAITVAQRVRATLVMTSAGIRAQHDPCHADDLALRLACVAPTDVWICKPQADPQVEHVLCAADTSRGSGLAVRRAVDLCRNFNARLRLLTVMPDPELLPADDVEPSIERLRTQQQQFLDGFDLDGVPLSREVVWSRHPAGEVLNEAGQHPEGLLLLGASSRLRRSGLGLVSAQVLRRCPSSVWVVRRPPPPSLRRRSPLAQAVPAT